MKKISINVTIHGATPEKLKATKASLIRQGVEVDSVLDAIGVITGKLAKSKFASLDAGPGTTVEISGSVQLPPPDSPLQ